MVSRAAKYFGTQRSLVRVLRHAPDLLTSMVAARSAPALAVQDCRWLNAGLRLDPPERRDPFGLEWRGVDFLADDAAQTVAAYADFWPHSGNIPTWDAVGDSTTADGRAWLLVEAKAHVGELRSACGAKPLAEGGSRELIAARLDAVKAALGVTADRDWMQPAYQFAHRIATLWFLHEQGIAAHLLYVCLIDGGDPGRSGPTPADWDRAVRDMSASVGRPFAHPLEDRIHTLVLPLAAIDPALSRTGGAST
jgi:hypothetical protein